MHRQKLAYCAEHILFEHVDSMVTACLSCRQMLTLTEYAKKIGRSRTWVYILITQGRIPGAKRVRVPGAAKGHVWMIPEDAKIKAMQ